MTLSAATPKTGQAFALQRRMAGLGLRATARALEISATTLARRERLNTPLDEETRARWAEALDALQGERLAASMAWLEKGR